MNSDECKRWLIYEVTREREMVRCVASGGCEAIVYSVVSWQNWRRENWHVRAICRARGVGAILDGSDVATVYSASWVLSSGSHSLYNTQPSASSLYVTSIRRCVCLLILALLRCPNSAPSLYGSTRFRTLMKKNSICQFVHLLHLPSTRNTIPPFNYRFHHNVYTKTC